MSIEQENSEIKRIIAVKPRDFKFIPGKALKVSLEKQGLENLNRFLTITSLNNDYYLEFLFKEYPRRDRFNEALSNLKAGEEIIISEESAGKLEYKGRGVFIASGIGIIPFIPIFKELKQDDLLNGNFLIYSEKSKGDLIHERELKHMFGKNCSFILTRESGRDYENVKLDENFIKEKINNFEQVFYVSGSNGFVEEIKEILQRLGAKSINVEVIE